VIEMGVPGIGLRTHYPTAEGAAAVHDGQDLRRALEAYRFFYPTVSLEGILHGTREAGARDNRSSLMFIATPRHLGFTLNSDTPYSGSVLDLRRDGPIVIELPPGPLVGLVDDHHQRWVTDLGLPGRDAGKGGKYLILPPEYDCEIPDAGYFIACSETNIVFCALRALPLDGDVEAAKRLLSSVSIHPLAQDRDSPPYEFIDWSEEAIDCTCLAWEDNIEFWRALHRVIDSEPAIEELRPMLGMLAELGIEAGKPFAPDRRMTAILKHAARAGREEMLVAAFASRRPDRIVWGDRRWEWAGLRPENGAFERTGSLDVEARDRWFAQAIVASPAMFRREVGSGSLYWLGHRDREGEYLDGTRTYRLTVPLPVPAKLFWSMTIYDAETRSEVVADQGKAALRSLFEKIDTGGDSVELYFGPEQPEGAEDRWIQTLPGRGWFSYFRIYGPTRAAFDGTWKPGDIEAVR
jgi:hypothetical protein